MKNLQQSSLSTLATEQDNDGSISLYTGVLTPQCVVSASIKLKNTFPALPKGFYDVLNDRIKEKGFSDKRLMDAVNHVIDTCVYPTPTIANIISFDKRIKLYTYDEVLKLLDTGASFEDFKVIERNGKKYRVKLADCEQYGIDFEMLNESRRC